MGDFERIVLRTKWWIFLDMWTQKRFSTSIGTCSVYTRMKSSWTYTWSQVWLCDLLYASDLRTNDGWTLRFVLFHILIYCTTGRNLLHTFNFVQDFKAHSKFFLSSSIKLEEIVCPPEGWFLAPQSRERQSGSSSGFLTCSGAYAVDQRGDESRGLSHPCWLPLRVTHCCWGELNENSLYLIYSAVRCRYLVWS